MAMEAVNIPKYIADDIYWLGMRRNVRLETNTYLAIFKHESKTLPLLIDPGGPNIAKRILKRLHAILGDIKKLRMVFLSHHDPDAAINLVKLLKLNPALVILCTEDVWRLAYALGVSSARFQPVESLNSGMIRLPWGRTLQFLPVPFCPSRGACMIYDAESRILFSGALFGGITFTTALFAVPQHWEGIRIWHQMYIPTNSVLQRALGIVRDLHPPPRLIAPQHGAILKDDMIPLVMERLANLPVGVAQTHATAIDKLVYLEAINDVLDKIRQQTGSGVVEHLLHRLDEDRSFPHLFTVKQGKLTDIQDDILDDVMGAFKMLLYALIQEQPADIQDIVRNAVIDSDWDVSTFMQSFVHRPEDTR
jgi:glyoxylase-like metal-dependent hydrolase (beta-lactamase superfamily II)